MIKEPLTKSERVGIVKETSSLDFLLETLFEQIC